MDTLGTPAKSFVVADNGRQMNVELQASQAILKGQPVKLHTDGTLRPWVGGTDKLALCIGISTIEVTSAQITAGPVYPYIPVVLSKGYAIVWGVTKHTLSGTLNAGPVTCLGASAVSGLTDRCVYDVCTDTTNYTDQIGWLLAPTTGIDTACRVLIRN
jgi:hypothetical protein